MSQASRAKLPSQIPFIIGSEGCERFSFYGMRNILQKFLALSLLVYLPADQRKGAATDVFHMFVAGVYFFPLLGGWISDRFWGKYKTIIWFSLIYCAGQACLSAFVDNRDGFYIGLLLVALGSGGIKPLVSSFVGDQFDSSNKHLAKIAFDAFYWIINFGSFFASLFMPMLLPWPRVAFAIPGILMFIATVVIWAGRRRYVMVPPAPPNPDSFLRVVRTALFTGTPGAGTVLAVVGAIAGLAFAVIGVLDEVGVTHLLGWGIVLGIGLGIVLLLAGSCTGATLQLARARGKHADAAIDGVRAVMRILIVFAFITPFWTLFDQKATTWVFQGDLMSKPSWFDSAQMQFVNPALVMILIPFNNLVLFPALRARGWEPTPLRKMTTGIALAGIAWIFVGSMQLLLDGHYDVNILWQLAPYIFLTLAEVLVSATGLEFAYSQAPAAMKGVIMAFWSLCVTIGNLWTLLATHTIRSPAVLDSIKDTGISSTAFLMFFFAFFAFASSIAFKLYARRYRMVDHYRA